MKTTVAWDADDVLNSLSLELYFRKFEERIPDSRSVMSVGDAFRAKGWSPDRYLEELDSFRSNHYMSLQRNELVYEWLLRDQSAAINIVVTRTPLWAASTTSTWVLENFSGLFSGLFFVPSPRVGCLSRIPFATKQDALSIVHSRTVLIDDDLQNAPDALSPVIFFKFPYDWQYFPQRVEECLNSLSSVLSSS